MRRLALAFPGQGSQKHGMGKALAAKYPNSAGRVFDEANAVLGGLFTNLVWNNDGDTTTGEMHQTSNAQPIILATSLAVLAALKERHGFELTATNTACVLGHSLGEYSALVAAGSLPLGDALVLVRERGLAMQRACSEWKRTPSMCAIVNLSWEGALEIQHAAAKEEGGMVCEAANDNGGKEQIVLSGCERGVDWGIARAKEKHGARRAIKIKGVSCPFHSSVMRPAAAEFAARLLVPGLLRPPTVPILLGESVQLTRCPDEIAQSLARGIYSPVRWASCLDKLLLLEGGEQGEVRFQELGSNTLRFGLSKWKHVGAAVRPEVDDVERGLD